MECNQNKFTVKYQLFDLLVVHYFVVSSRRASSRCRVAFPPYKVCLLLAACIGIQGQKTVQELVELLL
jgi:hypothetical protein